MEKIDRIIFEDDIKHFDLLKIAKKYYLQDEVLLVWYSKTIQNAKALIFNKTQDLFVEVTLNGDFKEVYFDEYKLVNKVTLK